MTKKLSDPNNTLYNVTSEEFYSVINNLNWQNSVNGIHNSNKPYPEAPKQGDRWLLLEDTTKLKGNHIYEYQNRQWKEMPQEEGTTVFVEDIKRIFIFTGNTWTEFEKVLSHNSLLNVHGGNYHLSRQQYNNLTSDSPKINDLSIEFPNRIYSLDHNKFKNYNRKEHLDWTGSIPNTIHSDNISSESIIQHEGSITHNKIGEIKGDSEGYHLSQSQYDNITSNTPRFNRVYLEKHDAYSQDEAVRKGYLDKVLKSEFIWNPSVVSFINPDSLPDYGYTGEMYIANSTTENGKENFIYRWNGVKWEEFQPKMGYIFLVESYNDLFVYVGEWLPSINIYDHNRLINLFGNGYYHLSKKDYENLTNSRPKFNDLFLTNPNSIYRVLDHNQFKNCSSDEHIDWTVTGNRKVHEDRIIPTSSSIHFNIEKEEWEPKDKYYKYELSHNLNKDFFNITCWNMNTKKVIRPTIESLDENNVRIVNSSKIRMKIIIG